MSCDHRRRKKGFHRVYTSYNISIVYPTVEYVIRMVPSSIALGTSFPRFPDSRTISGSLFTRSTAIHGLLRQRIHRP